MSSRTSLPHRPATSLLQNWTREQRLCKTATQDANKACMEARAAWRRHVTEHKCNKPEDSLAKRSRP